MADVSMRQLELFAALPSFSTLREAAAHLHISESALSHAISTLEAAVGQQLCVRRRARGLTLTPTGQQFAEQARAIVAATQELVLDARRGDELHGPVRVGCATSFATSVLPELLDGFPAVHPAVQVDSTVGSNEELLAALDAGRLDVAIVYDVALPFGYRRRPIYATALQALLHPEHPLAARQHLDLADLVDQPYVQYDATPGTGNVADAFAARGLTPTIATRVSQIGLVMALVGRGMGYGLLMSRPRAAAPDGAPRDVVAVPLDPPVTQIHVVGIWPEAMRLTPRASALLDFAAERLGMPDDRSREREPFGA